MSAVLSTYDVDRNAISVVHRVYEGYVESKPEKVLTVAILATHREDITRIARLLGRFVPEGTILAFHELGNHASTKLPVDECFAAIVCSRLSEHGSFARLPDNLKASRLIMLSDSNQEQAIMDYLAAGARHVFSLDDSDRLLQARLQASLRQHHRHATSTMTAGEFRFDLASRQVFRGGQLVDLTPREFDLACCLFSRMNKVVSSAELMTSIWSLPSFMDTRRIDTAACRVRKKLLLVPKFGWELKKVRCVGYRLNKKTADALELVSG